ncbi:MAG: IS1595 family transposase [Actinomycetota bacterium]|nr:IS1595 family transposase [Actinomycetota bacterium]
MEFMRDYRDDAACLEYLWRSKYAPDGETAHCPKCETERRFKKYATSQRRQSWTCTACGHHIHPTAGTIFAKSSTSLHLWFYAIYLMSSTRCGVSAKQLEREIGVNYKTALRMLQKIRTDLMAQDDDPLSGKVEADETFIGGKIRESERRKFKAEGRSNRGPYTKPRQIVFGAVERQGRIRAEVVPSSQGYVLREKIEQFVLPGSMVFTDDWSGYDKLRGSYHHRRINHSARVYVSGDVHTNTIEGFFGLFKTGVRGTHHSISKRWLPTYLNEWAWRYNHRDSAEPQFRLLLRSAARI